MVKVCRRVDPEECRPPIFPVASGSPMNDAFGNPQSVVVFGGTSDIPESLSPFSRRPGPVRRVGRTRSPARKEAEEFRRTVARVRTVTFDASTLDDAEKTVTTCLRLQPSRSTS